MVALLPAPADLGLPAKFTSWRHAQDRAVLRSADCLKRHHVPCAPTGFGKTLCYVTEALLSGKRTAILTATKGLEDQLARDFTSCGLVDIRGQNNYNCIALGIDGEYHGQGVREGQMCDAGPCHAGAKCSLRRGGCTFFDRLTAARDARILLSNYSFWIAQHRYADGLGKFELLILDESHDAADELSKALEVEIHEFDCRTYLQGQSIPSGDDPSVWKRWGQQTLEIATSIEFRLEEAIKRAEERGEKPDRDTLKERYSVRKLATKISVVATMEGRWIVERTAPKVARLAPVWPGPYAEKYLFLSIPKLVLPSATVRPKTMEILHVQQGDYDFVEYPSTFPVARRPVVFVPSVAVKYNWDETDQKTWVNRMDQIIDRRLDRKGIIHSMSYERSKMIMTYSRHRGIMLANEDSLSLKRIVQQYRDAPAPCVLVSPSVTTGWDFPFTECEYNIIAKIPFPDNRSPITKARSDEDPEYALYVAMHTIVQASGRGMRDEEDSCETFIVDNQWKWFWKQYKHFAPGWFKQAVQWSATIPVPLPKLTRAA